MPSSPEKQREYRLKRIAAGICPRCGKAADREGFTMCVACNAKYAAVGKFYRTSHRKPCNDCGTTRPKGYKKYCAACSVAKRIAVNKAAKKRYYERKKAAGLCQKCLQPSRENRTVCASCAGMQDKE